MKKAPFGGLWYAFGVQDDDDYPFTAWDDLKFTIWGGFVLLLPVALIALAGWFVYSLFA